MPHRDDVQEPIMRPYLRVVLTSLPAVGLGMAPMGSHATADEPGKPLRAGIIGCDTSHVIAFTDVINDPKAEGDLAGVRVVAAFPGGSKDVKDSSSRVDGYVKQLQGKGVEIVPSI